MANVIFISLEGVCFDLLCEVHIPYTKLVYRTNDKTPSVLGLLPNILNTHVVMLNNSTHD